MTAGWPVFPADARWIGVAQPAGSRNGKSWPAATFAVAVKDGRVVDAAPIARWALGKDARQVEAFYRGRGAIWRDLPPRQEVRSPA